MQFDFPQPAIVPTLRPDARESFEREEIDNAVARLVDQLRAAGEITDAAASAFVSPVEWVEVHAPRTGT
jgi:hypothetical protein